MQGFWSKNLFLKYPLMGEKKRNLQAEGILLLRNGLKNKKSQNSTTNAQLNEQVSEWIQS